MRFKSIYSFEVIKKIEELKTVYILDRQNREIYNANDLTAGVLVLILENSRTDKNNRYDFWIEEETEKERE